MSDASRDTQHGSPDATRVQELRDALGKAFASGDVASLDDWLDRFDQLQPELVRLEFVRAEVAEKRSRDETLSPGDFHERYPQAQAEIESVFGALESMDMAGDATETFLHGGMPGDLFSAATMAPGGPVGPGGDAAPEELGDYQLLDKLGEGGMGLVYSARQKSADRVVALKIVRPERLQAYSAERRQNAIDRFRTEAQSAAQLEHENIVTVYDVGEIDGQHYYSMRLVDGCSLADLLHEGPLLNDVAARYLRDTADGIAEAHSRGILHRDLKPQNVMVDKKTDRAMVADFGLAKVVHGDTELTRDGEIVGTPQYMAPEQIKDSAHVTASVDIYALGATLYHLLTGRPPFQAALAVDTLRQVMMQDPAPPRQLNAAIDLDLETICMKCLEKEPARRYDSAREVADELNRYLRNEPILARPLGPIGRGWRWCRRNPGLASAISAAALGLVLALTATTIGYITTSAAQARSEQSFRDALTVVNDFFSEVSEDSLLHAQGMQPLRKELLNRALNYYQKFLRQRANDPTLRGELAAAYYRVGRITMELESPEDALPFYNDALRIQGELLKESASGENLRGMGNIENAIGEAYTRMDRLDDALTHFQQAQEMRSRWRDADPDSVEAIRVLANTDSNIAHTYELQGEADAALEQYVAAQKLREELLDREPTHRKGRRDLAEGFYNQTLFRFEVANSERMDDELLPNETVQELLNLLERAIEGFDELKQEDVADINVRFQMTQCLRLKGDLYGEHQNADRAYQQAQQELERLSLQNPTVARYILDLAGVHRELGRLAQHRARFSEMAREFEQVIALTAPLVDVESPTSLRFQLAQDHMDHAVAQGVQAEELQFDVETLTTQAAKKPDEAKKLNAEAAKKSAEASKKRKRALAAFGQAESLLAQLSSEDPSDQFVADELQACREMIADVKIIPD